VPEAAIFAVDYQVAGQIWYYAGFPVHTSWKQYPLWGASEICRPDASWVPVQIVALSYVDPGLISQQLHDTFAIVDGPEIWRLGEGDEQNALRIWTAKGCRVDQETFLRRFDLLRLLQEEDKD
jgi:hypothetical protein